MISLRIQVFFAVILSSGIFGCGSSESSQITPVDPIVIATGTSWRLKAFNPLAYGVNISSADPTHLVSVQNMLELFQYDAIVEPSLDLTRTEATSFITGIGIDAVDNSGNPLTTTLTVEAREFNPSTGNFSGTTRIFADHLGADVVGGQNFVILNTNSPNYLLTGLGLKMKNARISNLFLQRKTIGGIAGAGDPMSGGTRVELPAGWAAVGFILKVRGSVGSAVPFVQDAVVYMAQLVSN